MQSKPNAVLQSIWHVLAWLIGVTITIGLGWVFYLGTLEVLQGVVGEREEEAFIIPAMIVDIGLLVGLCALFVRWLHTQPNPIDS
jgi:hypothetical protein